MTSKELNLKLVRAIPGIAPSYQQEVEWQEGDETGSHVVYEDVLAPYIPQAAGAGDRDGLDEIFGFIEQLLETGDGYAEEVVALSVLEALGQEEKIRNACLPFMKTKTKKLFSELG